MDEIFASPFYTEIFPGLVLVALLAWIIFHEIPPPSSLWPRLRGQLAQLDQLGNELDRRFDRVRSIRRLPVYSAETVHGKEAEFIRERLPRKAPYARFVLLLFLIGVLAWWFARQFA
jgi:hypothetical protein